MVLHNTNSDPYCSVVPMFSNIDSFIMASQSLLKSISDVVNFLAELYQALLGSLPSPTIRSMVLQSANTLWYTMYLI